MLLTGEKPDAALAADIGSTIDPSNTEQAGAKVVTSAHVTFWGGYGGYFQDPDGHLWEVVFNPDFESLG